MIQLNSQYNITGITQLTIILYENHYFNTGLRHDNW